MSRSIAEIKQSIITAKNNQSVLNDLNSPSQTSIYNLWAYVIAVSVFMQETLWDLFKTNLETDIANAPIGTDAWVNEQAYKFQYSTSTPQIISLDNNFVPTYPVTDLSLRLISRASTLTMPNRLVRVKVAKNNPPEALSITELTAFKGYLDEISFAGVQYNTTSLSGDPLYVGATIYYNGQYASTITGDTVLALTNYMQNLPFDGYVRVSKIEDAIQGVIGVNDVVLNNIAIRPASLAFSGTTYLVQNNTEIYNKYPMYAGYTVPEFAPNDYNTSLMFIPS